MSNDELAGPRFFVLSAIRLVSAALVITGLLIYVGKIAAPKPAGIAFVVFGFLEFVLLPRFLARKWKTPGQ